jgi:hypothetical protein
MLYYTTNLNLQYMYEQINTAIRNIYRVFNLKVDRILIYM